MAARVAPEPIAREQRRHAIRRSQGIITHLRARTPSGRVVEHPDGTITTGWKDEEYEGRWGFMAVTEDGRGAWTLCDTHGEAMVEVCDRLGLDKGSIIGGDHSRGDAGP